MLPPELHPNILALLGCVALRMAVGALWYSPLLFLRGWQKVAGVSDKQMQAGMAKAIASDVIGSFVMAFVLVHAVRYSTVTTMGGGLFVGFFNWLGLVAVVQLGSVFYERRPWKFFFINAGYQFVTIVPMGAILAVWG